MFGAVAAAGGFGTMSVKELKKELMARGGSTNGLKKVLVDRLENWGVEADDAEEPEVAQLGASHCLWLCYLWMYVLADDHMQDMYHRSGLSYAELMQEYAGEDATQMLMQSCKGTMALVVDLRIMYYVLSTLSPSIMFELAESVYCVWCAICLPYMPALCPCSICLLCMPALYA